MAVFIFHFFKFYQEIVFHVLLKKSFGTALLIIYSNEGFKKVNTESFSRSANSAIDLHMENFLMNQ